MNYLGIQRIIWNNNAYIYIYIYTCMFFFEIQRTILEKYHAYIHIYIYICIHKLFRNIKND